MKSTTILLILIFMTSTLFAQFIMVEDENGDVHYQKVEKTNKITFGTPPTFSTCGDIVLYEGKYYGTIQIGTQCWFDENLNVGTMINSTNGGTDSDGEQTNNSIIEKYCYDNDETNCNSYGGLYQWNETMQYVTTEGTQGICPSGWHIPTFAEFETLKALVNSSGNALKSVGVGDGSGIGTNTSGFSALLAGGYYYGTTWSQLGDVIAIWSSIESNSWSYVIGLNRGTNNVYLFDDDRAGGFSVRCLKD